MNMNTTQKYVEGACTLQHAAGSINRYGRDALHHAANAVAGFNLTAGLVIDHALFCDAKASYVNPAVRSG